MKGMFWRVCVLWALLLGSVFLTRSFILRSGPVDSSELLPTRGQKLVLPPTITTTTGGAVPTLGVNKMTLFLVTGAGCVHCQRELPTYPGFLRMAEELGYLTRIVVVPGTEESNEWFLERVPTAGDVVFDATGLARFGLGTRVTPSIVILDSDGLVEAAYSPAGEWPVTYGMLARILVPKLKMGVVELGPPPGR